jgi:hypothetical protein
MDTVKRALDHFTWSSETSEVRRTCIAERPHVEPVPEIVNRCCAPEKMGHATPEFRGCVVYVCKQLSTMSTYRNKGLKELLSTL